MSGDWSGRYQPGPLILPEEGERLDGESITGELWRQDVLGVLPF